MPNLEERLHATVVAAEGAASAARDVLRALERAKAPAVEAPAVEAPALEAPAVEAPAVEAPVVFYCQATNCRGMGWRPRADFPHPRTCLADDKQAAWPGACAIER